MRLLKINDGEILKLIRLQRGLNQKGLGKTLGISQQAVAKLEKKDCLSKGKILAILIALKSSQKEFEDFKNLLYPPRKVKD